MALGGVVLVGGLKAVGEAGQHQHQVLGLLGLRGQHGLDRLQPRPYLFRMDLMRTMV